MTFENVILNHVCLGLFGDTRIEEEATRCVASPAATSLPQALREQESVNGSTVSRRRGQLHSVELSGNVTVFRLCWCATESRHYMDIAALEEIGLFDPVIVVKVSKSAISDFCFNPTGRRKSLAISSTAMKFSLGALRKLRQVSLRSEQRRPHHRRDGGVPTLQISLARRIYDIENLKEPFCGGSIINTRYVVTAAHCMFSPKDKPEPASKFRVKIAEHDVISEDDDVEGVTRMLALESYVFHEGYTENYFNLDIALLRLEEAWTSRRTRRTDRESRRLGRHDQWRQEVPDIVREVDLPIVECGRKEIAGVLITPFMLCAGFKKGGKDSCSGDSGGPLTVEEDGRFTLVGIVSFGEECAKRNVPGVYTRITELLEWISSNTAEVSYCQ
nr:anionic trypsin-2-like [Penaeus vannamei]